MMALSYRHYTATCMIKFSRNGPERRSATCVFVPSPAIAVPPPKVVVPPPGNIFMVHTVFFGRLILRKIINVVATRCQILRLKSTKFDIGWGFAPDSTGGAYSSPRTPSWIQGCLLL